MSSGPATSQIKPAAAARLLSIDVMRGITVGFMIPVNNNAAAANLSAFYTFVPPRPGGQWLPLLSSGNCGANSTTSLKAEKEF